MSSEEDLDSLDFEEIIDAFDRENANDSSKPVGVIKLTQEEREYVDRLREVFPVSSRKALVLFSLVFLEELFFTDEGDLLLGVGSDLSRISSAIESIDISLGKDEEMISKMERMLLSGMRLQAVLGLGEGVIPTPKPKGKK
jgi:hypothetical protein